MPIVELSIVPIGTGSTSVSEYVQAALAVVKASGLDYAVNPMGTCIQGDWDRIFSLIREIHEKLAQMGCQRLVTTIKIDDRRDKRQTMADKLRAVGAGGG